MGTGSLSRGAKRLVRYLNHTPDLEQRLKKEYSYTSTPPPCSEAASKLCILKLGGNKHLYIRTLNGRCIILEADDSFNNCD